MNAASVKIQFLQKILQSPEFLNSKLDQDLLRFLYNAAEQKIKTKESTIAIEFFNRKSNFNSSGDTIVRVHMYNLRKKLSLYYLSDGKNDKIQLCIPKGHYELKFVKNNINENKIKNIVFKPIYLLILLLVFLTILLFFQWRENTALKKATNIDLKNESTSFWVDYLQSENPILFVFGNHLNLWEYENDIDNGKLIYDSKINNVNNPTVNLEKNHESFLCEHRLFSIFSILPVLKNANYKPEYISSSQLKWRDIAEHNIIFIGKVSTFFRLKKIFSKYNFAFNINPQELYYLDKNSDTLKTYLPEYKNSNVSNFDSYRYYVKDYPIITKIPGPNNLPILFFTGFFDAGIKETIRHLTIPLLTNKLEKLFVEKYGYIPEYFDILFEVEGYEKTKISSKILHINEIK